MQVYIFNFNKNLRYSFYNYCHIRFLKIKILFLRKVETSKPSGHFAFKLLFLIQTFFEVRQKRFSKFYEFLHDYEIMIIWIIFIKMSLI